MSNGFLYPNSYRLIGQIAAEAGPLIMASTVPIYQDVEGENPIDFDRTGLLFRIGSESFVLSASHGIEQCLEEKTMLYVDVSRRTQAPILLADCQFYGTEVGDGFPDRDIVAIHLSQNAVDQFYPQRRFLTLADCDRTIDPTRGLYLIAGFPSDTYQINPVAEGKTMFYFGDVEANPTTMNFDPLVHLALTVAGYGVRATENGFVADAIPEFHGMSGCGIWRVASHETTDAKSWDSSKVRLVAIQNRTQADSHTIGTWIKHLVERVIDDFPHLRPATEIAYQPGY